MGEAAPTWHRSVSIGKQSVWIEIALSIRVYPC